MNGNPSALVTPLIISAMRIACSSLSITHGPAIRNRSPEPIRMSPTWKEEIKSEPFHGRAPREHGAVATHKIKIEVRLSDFLDALGGRTLYRRVTFSGR